VEEGRGTGHLKTFGRGRGGGKGRVWEEVRG